MVDPRLISLLASKRSDPLVAACHEYASGAVDIPCLPIGPLASAEVVDIYTIRARINERKRGGIEGFQQLVRAFGDPLPANIQLYDLGGLPPNRFMIFTDENMQHLFGVLRFRTSDEKPV